MGKKRGNRSRRSYGDEEDSGFRPRQSWQQQDGRSQEPKKSSKKVVVQAKTQGQKQYILNIKNNDITFCVGPAGSGKTAIAIGLGLEGVLASNPAYDRIVVLRPAKEACGERIGFLPGDMSDKMAPWAAPVVDNMEVFIDKNAIKNLLYMKKFEVIPLAYARGRSLNGAFIILDEAQNCSKEQMLMVLTRIGMGSKLVINGDVDQNDNPQGGSGLMDAIERLEGMDGVAVTRLEASDIVRNPIIGKILARYKSSYTIGTRTDADEDYQDDDDDMEGDYEDEEDYEDGDEMVDFEDEAPSK